MRDCGPGDLDWVIVRENSEGEYAGHGGRAHRGFPEEVATETAIFTRAGVSRIMRFAFELARSRPRRHLTVVTKSNAQRHGMVMWDGIAAEMALDFPDVTVDKELVDAMTTRMVRRRHRSTRSSRPICTPISSAISRRRWPGSMGSRRLRISIRSVGYPSMFEPIHGSAFDITGKGIANPIGTFWTGAMMLDHLGESGWLSALMQAVERVTAAGAPLTPDLGGNATTREVTDAVIAALRGVNR